VPGTELLPAPAIIVFVALFGAMLGSFLNVVIHRLPRKESVVFPPSACPACKKPIRPWDNIPVVSWLLLGGRCRNCKAGISARYPLVEALAAVLTVVIVWQFGFTITTVAYLFFTLALLAITLIDLEHRIIPDAITLPGTVIGLLLVNWTHVTWVEALIGASLGFALLFFVGLVYEKVTGVEGMGGGDVKMAAMMGAFLGWKGIFLTIFFGSFLGSIAGIITMARGRGGRRTALPFGTFLAPAAVFVLFLGEVVIDWYLGLIYR
jgi:leader peptidase (prepilin peptidase) / N-methyltransferase